MTNDEEFKRLYNRHARTHNKLFNAMRKAGIPGELLENVDNAGRDMSIHIEKAVVTSMKGKQAER